jgi:glycosyltransferase involved in cell wall biosynthesis
VTSALTIGIDARAAVEVPAGRGRLVRELLAALGERDDPHRYRCYARTRWPHTLDERFEWRLVDGRDPLWHWRAARAVDRECDAFLATNSYLSVLLTRRPSVAIVYDLVALDPATSPNRRSALIERLTLDAAVRRARGLVCISESTRAELVARTPAVARKATVALLAAGGDPGVLDDEEARRLPGPGFVLAVGTLEPRKNLPRLVDAYARLPADLQARHPLVVVGAAGWRTGETFAALRSLGDRCQTLGHVSDAALAELYRRCAVFCYPSLAEGFGLPVLEAMAAGAPVLTSNVSSMPEVGGRAAAYADPGDTASIAGELRALLEDPERREALARAGVARAAEFSWTRFAGEVLESLEQAAQASARS